MVKITTKITGVQVVKPDETPTPTQLPDEDPLTKRIENRPDEPLEAVIEKVQYNTQQGRKKVYVAVSFLAVDGLIKGESITVERPIEIFLPAGQTEDDGQWIVATMRSLSLAARGGYLTRALQDLRQVPWTKGPVRCGNQDYGNGKLAPVHHPSEVAAIAYAIQRILHRRGFLDVEGNQVPIEVLARRYSHQRLDPDQVEEPGSNPELKLVESNPEPENTTGTPGKTCPQCGESNVRPLDGCDTCMDCGHSKCA